MLQSVIVYGIMCLSLYFFPRVNTYICDSSTIITIRPRQYTICVVCGLLIFSFFSGVRWDVGIDHLAYLMEYEYVGMLNHTYRTDMEIGFVQIMLFFNKLGLHFSIFFGFIAFVQLAFVYSYFKDCRYLIPFVGVLVMCGGDYFAWMNGIRQCIVATFYLFMVRYLIIERRPLLFLLCVYLATFIHKSAFLLITFYPLTYLKLEKIHIKKQIQYVLFLSALFLSSLNLWQQLLAYVDPLFEFVGYDRFDNMERLIENERTQNFGPRKIIFFLIDFIIISLSDRLRKAYPDKLFGFSYIMFVLLYITQPLFVNSLVVSRIIIYYNIFRVIVTSYLLFYLFKRYKASNKLLLGIGILFLYVLRFLIQVYVDKGGHTGCIRYQFFWDYWFDSPV